MSKVWDKKLQKSEKFLEKSRTHGRKVYERYKDDRDDTVSGTKKANFFFSNTNTLKQSLFNSLPKPDVSRMHKGDYEADEARVAAMILQRALTYEVKRAPSFKDSIEYAILDRLVPGTGQVWFRFDEPEQVHIDTLYWEDFLYEPARCWDLVNWVARKHELEKDQFIERYGEEAFAKAESVKSTDTTITPKEISDGKFCVYEIWDRRKKMVHHVLKGVDDDLKTISDPYKLKHFFPCPKPMLANTTTTAFLPVTDYHLAQDQYIELDNLYSRMSLITTAIKVAGGYDSGTPELGNMLKGTENILIPVDNWAMYAEKGGTKGLIDWYPVEQIVTVYQALQSQYEAVKATLYEITGMSDIMRGASNQYETASAQEIKAQFASVRMNGYQRDVSNFVSEILNIMSQMMCALYSDEKFKAMIGNFTEADQQYLPGAAQLLRNQLLLCYNVDIEADSLTQADWALEKGQRTELVGYISQFLQSAVPAIEAMPEMATMLTAMLKFTIVGYKGAAEIEGILDQQLAALQQKASEPAEPEEPSPEELKAQAEQQKMQLEAQIAQQESEQRMALEKQQAEADMAVARQKTSLESQILQAKMDHQANLNAMEMQMRQAELEFKREEQRLKLEGQLVSAEIKASADREKREHDKESRSE